MISSGAKRLEYKYGDEFNLKPLADVHLGAKACDELAFKRYLADSDERTHFIGVGDLLDSIIVTDPRYRKAGDGTEAEAVIDEQIDRMVALLKPYSERILGLGDGNHEDTITRRCGTNPTKRICETLGVPFLGFSWLYRLQFTVSGGRGRTVTIRGHHGWGGGSRTQGADLTKYARDVSYYDADLFLYGHVHRRQHDEVPRLSLVGKDLIAKPKVMVLCGTFLKTLSSDESPTYSEAKGYPPVSIGGATVTIKMIDPSPKIQVTL